LNVLGFDTKIDCQSGVALDRQCYILILICNNNGVLSAARTSKSIWLKHYFDKITYRIGQKVASCANMPLENAESFQVIYYDVNGGIDPESPTISLQIYHSMSGGTSGGKGGGGQREFMELLVFKQIIVQQEY
jgi:hypothetical protein